MLAIRLTRTGKTHDPHYRLVVQEKRSKLNGKAVDIIGHYHPAQKDKQLVVNNEKAKHWLSKGAQPSDTVTNLLVKAGVLDASHRVSNFYTPKPKEAAVEEAAPADPPAEEAATTEETAEVAAEDPVAEAADATEEVAAADEETPAA
jgi:small subunit ribosomal protein S16